MIIPTDTVYGVAAHPGVPGATARLFAAKSRDESKPIPLLVTDISRAVAMGAVVTDADVRMAASFWPGPLTIVLAVRGGSETGAVDMGDSEGFRVPDSRIALALLAEVGGCLRVTSANLSGKPEAMTAAEAVEALGGSVGVVLDAGPAPGGVPSTVVRMSGGDLAILREGAIGRAALSQCLAGETRSAGRAARAAGPGGHRA